MSCKTLPRANELCEIDIPSAVRERMIRGKGGGRHAARYLYPMFMWTKLPISRALLQLGFIVQRWEVWWGHATISIVQEGKAIANHLDSFPQQLPIGAT